MVYIPYNFHDILKGRLGLIDQLGTSQNEAVAAAVARKQQQQALEEQRRYQDALNQSANIANQNQAGLSTNLSATKASTGTSTGVSTGGSSSFNAFKQAISGQESGGSYSARNASSGAMGKYQIMPGNLSGRGTGWDYEALGRDVTSQQFMGSPQIQEQIASHKLKYYYDKYGPAGAAIAWYAGEGSAQKFARSGRASTGAEGNYPSVSSYMRSILNRLGL